MRRGQQTSRMSTFSHPRPVSALCRVALVPPALTESLLKREENRLQSPTTRLSSLVSHRELGGAGQAT